MRVIAIIVVTSLFFSCESHKMHSRLMSFHYGGNGDSTLSVIHGMVKLGDKDSINKKHLIKVSAFDQNGKMYKSLLCDSGGMFSIGFPKDNFMLQFSKQGFEPLKVINYHSTPDQVSSMQVFLEMGNKEQENEIPDAKQN